MKMMNRSDWLLLGLAVGGVISMLLALGFGLSLELASN
jgi:hypothetical protein